MQRSSLDVVRRSPNIAQRLFEGSMLVITGHDSMLHKFNEVGTYIWGLIASPLTREEILGSVSQHFCGVEKEALSTDIDKFIDKMEQRKLVTVTSFKK